MATELTPGEIVKAMVTAELNGELRAIEGLFDAAAEHMPECCGYAIAYIGNMVKLMAAGDLFASGLAPAEVWELVMQAERRVGLAH